MKLSWGHGVIIALGSFMLFILGMIFLFPMGKQNAELITENYYEEELHYQNVIDAKNKADLLTEKPQVELKSNDGIHVIFPESNTNANTKINFYLFHSADKNLDIKKETHLDEQNSFVIPKNVLKKGNYVLKLMWKKDYTDYQRDFTLEWE